MPRCRPHVSASASSAARLCWQLLLLLLFCVPPASAGEGTAVPYRFDDVVRWSQVFDAPERAHWQQTDRVIQAIGIQPGEVIADIGAGSGYFTFRFARATGSQGKVYAVEIERTWLDYLEARAVHEGLSNIETVQAGTAVSGLPAACCDVIFLCNTYYMIADRVAYLEHLAEGLRPGGRVVIIDWLRRPLPRGPALHYKLTTQQVHSEIRQAGLEVVLQPGFLPWQYFFIAGLPL